MAQKRKRSASRASGTKSKKKSNVGSATTNSYDKEEVHPIQKPTKRKGSQKVEHAVGETIEYDPVHKGSSRRARGKVTKVLTGAKKSDPTTSEDTAAVAAQTDLEHGGDGVNWSKSEQNFLKVWGIASGRPATAQLTCVNTQS
ncbi:unnamed protein product [Didymodactylos carnosus]|uniref:Uncharacterized protein n=1 Tax=Didymodactylos carnosus TaxID=1234261 RepID=A0A815D920_9BILA|nr:unnamed protein product [Didymodactylos carnosus]CAF1294813.1 unnamed protein product [Didymodactylos carnosus]CAF4090963.1 unnamed protein product [Didymodactylos carnosus]CAF4107514.1 unnamed protein product [Didymodactylos carnosus]